LEIQLGETEQASFESVEEIHGCCPGWKGVLDLLESVVVLPDDAKAVVVKKCMGVRSPRYIALWIQVFIDNWERVLGGCLA
jgi:hypothetical protein